MKTRDNNEEIFHTGRWGEKWTSKWRIVFACTKCASRRQLPKPTQEEDRRVSYDTEKKEKEKEAMRSSRGARLRSSIQPRVYYYSCKRRT